jgi:NADH-quinone oxidoreductase subunit K
MTPNSGWIPVFEAFATIVAVAGLYCMVATRNMIRTLIGVELLIKAATMWIALAGWVTGKTALAQTVIITIIVIEVVIMVVAGGIVLGVFRHTQTIDRRELRNLKG